MALDMQRLDKEMKTKALSQKMTNMSVSKIILWEIDVMNNKIQSLERRPDIFNDYEDALYQELTLK
jgi:PIN domain nuclease of toxin-antitoxin system